MNIYICVCVYNAYVLGWATTLRTKIYVHIQYTAYSAPEKLGAGHHLIHERRVVSDGLSSGVQVQLLHRLEMGGDAESAIAIASSEL